MSVTVTLHVMLKTQLICGADVVTTFKAADADPASATIPMDTKSRRTNKPFISFSLRYLNYALVVRESRQALQKVTGVTGRAKDGGEIASGWTPLISRISLRRMFGLETDRLSIRPWNV